MPYYAQLNGGTVVAVTETHSALAASADLVDIDGLHADLLGKTYDRTTGEFVDPAPPPPPPPSQWAWYIDIGPFFDRFGAAKMAVLTSTDAGVKAILADTQVRKWIDLQRPDVAQSVAYIGSVVSAVTPALQTAILTTPVTPEENLALRKLYFS